MAFPLVPHAYPHIHGAVAVTPSHAQTNEPEGWYGNTLYASYFPNSFIKLVFFFTNCSEPPEAHFLFASPTFAFDGVPQELSAPLLRPTSVAALVASFSMHWICSICALLRSHQSKRRASISGTSTRVPAPVLSSSNLQYAWLAGLPLRTCPPVPHEKEQRALVEHVSQT